MEPKFDSKRVLKLSAFLFVISVVLVYYIFEFDEWLDDNELAHGNSKQSKLDDDLYVNNQDDVKKLNHVDNDDSGEDSIQRGGHNEEQDDDLNESSKKINDDDHHDDNEKTSEHVHDEGNSQTHKVSGKGPEKGDSKDKLNNKYIRNPTGRRLRY
ncbi:hypothetical protein CLIB1444_01S04962 [[Candida] jaroonii]|uniref:Uncharacterized protein n=1 Tax=[Candida] jaroonii TaxID=467808 RepID=A0ACA9Y0F2_9ASCO|nr:hypothetical protein CLIB1444_01S04962 [[Candida] jaroonii]